MGTKPEVTLTAFEKRHALEALAIVRALIVAGAESGNVRFATVTASLDRRYSNAVSLEVRRPDGGNASVFRPGATEGDQGIVSHPSVRVAFNILLKRVEAAGWATTAGLKLKLSAADMLVRPRGED